MKALWQLCKGPACELSVVWQPREHAVQQCADELCKLPDGSTWAIESSVFARLVQDLIGLGREFTIDLFADETNCQVSVAKKGAEVPCFFSR